MARHTAAMTGVLCRYGLRLHCSQLHVIGHLHGSYRNSPSNSEKRPLLQWWHDRLASKWPWAMPSQWDTDQKTYAATAGLPCPTCSVRGDKESQHPRFHHPCESANVCKHTCSPRRVPHGSTFGGLQRVCASGDVQNQIAGYTSDVVKGLGIKRYASHLHEGHTSI